MWIYYIIKSICVDIYSINIYIANEHKTIQFLYLSFLLDTVSLLDTEWYELVVKFGDQKCCYGLQINFGTVWL